MSMNICSLHCSVPLGKSIRVRKQLRVKTKSTGLVIKMELATAVATYWNRKQLKKNVQKQGLLYCSCKIVGMYYTGSSATSG